MAFGQIRPAAQKNESAVSSGPEMSRCFSWDVWSCLKMTCFFRLLLQPYFSATTHETTKETSWAFGVWPVPTYQIHRNAATVLSSRLLVSSFTKPDSATCVLQINWCLILRHVLPHNKNLAAGNTTSRLGLVMGWWWAGVTHRKSKLSIACQRFPMALEGSGRWCFFCWI